MRSDNLILDTFLDGYAIMAHDVAMIKYTLVIVWTLLLVFSGKFKVHEMNVVRVWM